jgi:hypothetical protein
MPRSYSQLLGRVKPYWVSDNDGIVLIEGDCRDVLAELPAESVSCCVTDPPYNVGKDFGNGPKADRRPDYEAWLSSVWESCGRVVMNGGFLVFTNRIAYLPVGMLAVPPPWRFFHVEVWHKPLSLAGCWYGIAPHWEPIFVYVKGKPWRPFRGELVMSDVHEANVVTDGLGSGHPTVKPISLMVELIEHYCPKSICVKCGRPRVRIIENKAMVIARSGRAEAAGCRTLPSGTMLEPPEQTTLGWTDCGCAAGWTPGLILDPFIGTGTSGIAARKLGRRCIGIDASREYLDQAVRRLTVGDAGVRRMVAAERAGAKQESLL